MAAGLLVAVVPEIVEDEGEKEEDDDAAAGGSRVVRAEVGLDGRMALVAMASSRSVPPPLACVGRTWVRVLRAIVITGGAARLPAALRPHKAEGERGGGSVFAGVVEWDLSPSPYAF